MSHPLAHIFPFLSRAKSPSVQEMVQASVTQELEKRSITSNLKNPSNWLIHLLGGGPTKSKAVVNRNTAKTITAVYAAVKIISEGMASLPFHVMQEVNDNKTIAKNHPVHFLISKEPNRLQTSYNFRRQLFYDACMKGDGYAYIRRDGSGRPVELEYIFDAVPYLNRDNELWYQITRLYGLQGSQSMTQMVSADDMIHISGLSENGITGIDVIIAQKENLGISISATDFAAAYFGNGLHSPGMLKHPLRLTNDAALRLGRSFSKKYGGTNEIPVLDEGMEWIKTGGTLEESMLVDIKKFQVEQVSRMFTVPLHLLSSLDRATFNNIEVMNTTFVTNCLGPWAEHTEQEFNRKLFTDAEKRNGTHYTNFDFRNLLRGDTEARAKYYLTMFQIGAMSPNDIRRAENMNDREGGEEYFVPLNFTNDPNAITNVQGKKTEAAEAEA